MATDPNVMGKTGKSLRVTDLVIEYGFFGHRLGSCQALDFTSLTLGLTKVQR
jgi:hypothetical protein